MNIELRTTVLKASISIEDTLSTLLSHLFNIKKDASLTLGFKSSSLSFSSKVDLLRDLNRISAEEQKDFRLFMEIRNKLMHNLSVDTMLKALISIDKAKINQLLNTDDRVKALYGKCSTDEEKEEILILAFHSLSIKLNSIFSSALQSLIAENNERMKLEKSKIAQDMLDCLIKAIDKFSDAFDSVSSSDSENLGFANKMIGALFQKELESLNPDYKLPTPIE